mmetsp:Transcript_23875/g.60294  ORF Transcript_23875/g.60294 Transcript_23875/m.60294 type:complete len:278 (+) Transcript_23875:121-954(+)
MLALARKRRGVLLAGLSAAPLYGAVGRRMLRTEASSASLDEFGEALPGEADSADALYGDDLHPAEDNDNHTSDKSRGARLLRRDGKPERTALAAAEIPRMGATAADADGDGRVEPGGGAVNKDTGLAAALGAELDGTSSPQDSDPEFKPVEAGAVSTTLAAKLVSVLIGSAEDSSSPQAAPQLPPLWLLVAVLFVLSALVLRGALHGKRAATENEAEAAAASDGGGSADGYPEARKNAGTVRKPEGSEVPRTGEDTSGSDLSFSVLDDDPYDMQCQG